MELIRMHLGCPAANKLSHPQRAALGGARLLTGIAKKSESYGENVVIIAIGRGPPVSETRISTKIAT
jgi:hypothetical protein